MKRFILLTLLLAGLSSSSANASFQTVQFKVPVNINNLSSVVKSITIGCQMINPVNGGILIGAQGGILGRTDIPVVNGALAGTFSVPVTVDTAALNPQNPWSCILFLNLGSGFVAGSSKMPSLTATEYYLKPKAGMPFIVIANGKLP